MRSTITPSCTACVMGVSFWSDSMSCLPDNQADLEMVKIHGVAGMLGGEKVFLLDLPIYFKSMFCLQLSLFLQ